MVLTRINNNVSAINANRNLGSVSTDLSRSLERLSSGLRINRAADDAAGLSISERQRSQIRGLNRAIANAQDAIGLINTSEGALNETTARLQRVRELSIQALNSGGSDSDAIQAAQDEIETAIQEITRIGNTTQFSTRVLLNGQNSTSTGIQANTPARGVSIAQTPVNSSLPDGVSFLRMTQTQVGSQAISAGPDGVGNIQITGASFAGNTFATGDYTLQVSNVQQAAAQVIQTGGFTEAAGGAVNIGTTLQNLNYAGRRLEIGDVLRLNATLDDGTVRTGTLTITSTTTFSALRNNVDGLFTAGSNLTYGNIGAAGEATTLIATASGTGPSSLALTIAIDAGNNGLADATDIASVTTLGTDNTAVLSLDNGPAQTVRAGQTVTMYGRESTDGSPTPQITFTIGTTVGISSDGVDILNLVSDEYTARLNGGREVTFRPGEQEVLFRSGNAAGFSSGDFLVLNFDTNISLTAGTPAQGDQATVTFETVNNGLVFQIGANQGQNLVVGIGDLRASSLGFVGGLNVNGESFAGTVDAIDVRTRDGAENAIRIVDRALAQVSRQRSFLGATSNRLEATIANLGVAAENLTAAESRIRDADIAFETTQFTRNQIMVQAATSVLAQANLAPQSVLQLLA